MIKAFLFDVDGVLVDTSSISMDLTTEFFQHKGFAIDRESMRKNLGMGMKNLFARPAMELGIEVDQEEAMAYFRSRYSEILAQRDVALPGAANLIRMAQQAGIKCAIASSAPAWRVKENLAALGIDPDSMDKILSAEDVVRNKPFGDIYQSCLIAFGINGKEAIVFEDAIGGIQAGKNAGCYVCGLETSVSREEAKAAGADVVLENLSCFPEFTSSEDLTKEFRRLMGIGPNAKKYGANWITPLDRKMPDSFVEKKAKEAAFAAMKNAYTPYSHFHVGAAVVSAATGKIYAGCNVENAGYGDTICAERNAITTAITAEGAIGIDLVVITSESQVPAQPCGSCRQVMSEFIRPETPVILTNSRGDEERYVFSDLLPHPFTFDEV